MQNESRASAVGNGSKAERTGRLGTCRINGGNGGLKLRCGHQTLDDIGRIKAIIP